MPTGLAERAGGVKRRDAPLLAGGRGIARDRGQGCGAPTAVSSSSSTLVGVWWVRGVFRVTFAGRLGRCAPPSCPALSAAIRPGTLRGRAPGPPHSTLLGQRPSPAVRSSCAHRECPPVPRTSHHFTGRPAAVAAHPPRGPLPSWRGTTSLTRPPVGKDHSCQQCRFPMPARRATGLEGAGLGVCGKGRCAERSRVVHPPRCWSPLLVGAGPAGCGRPVPSSPSTSPQPPPAPLPPSQLPPSMSNQPAAPGPIIAAEARLKVDSI